MESIQGLIEKRVGSKYPTFIEIGKMLREWYEASGYIRTNFGWLHKDWIDMGFKMQAIAPEYEIDGYRSYRVVAFITTEDVYEGTGRTKTRRTKEKYDTTRYEDWIRYLDTKKQTTFLPEELVEGVHKLIYG